MTPETESPAPNEAASTSAVVAQPTLSEVLETVRKHIAERDRIKRKIAEAEAFLNEANANFEALLDSGDLSKAKDVESLVKLHERISLAPRFIEAQNARLEAQNTKLCDYIKGPGVDAACMVSREKKAVLKGKVMEKLLDLYSNPGEAEDMAENAAPVVALEKLARSTQFARYDTIFKGAEDRFLSAAENLLAFEV